MSNRGGLSLTSKNRKGSTDTKKVQPDLVETGVKVETLSHELLVEVTAYDIFCFGLSYHHLSKGREWWSGSGRQHIGQWGPSVGCCVLVSGTELVGSAKAYEGSFACCLLQIWKTWRKWGLHSATLAGPVVWKTPLIGEVLHACGHWPPTLGRGTFKWWSQQWFGLSVKEEAEEDSHLL